MPILFEFDNIEGQIEVVKTVAVAVDTRDVRFDVLAQRVGMLDEEAERLESVGRDERARRGKGTRRIFARRILHARTMSLAPK